MLAPPLLFVALAVLFWVGMEKADPNALKSTREGGPAPALALEPLEGQELFTDADLRAGQVVLVNFWASWCVACRAEHPMLLALKEEGLQIYGIDYKDEAPKARKYLDELGDPYVKGGADPSGRTAIEWGLYGVPETFVIAGDGTVILRFAGPITERVLEAKIRPAIAEAEARGAQGSQ
ncbi:MAG TPA: DsbE family thiol:disulfide interchange protein [Aliiroseovarius sp.]|nr:DsbE family thiol:disulfide interchange protein [Aliiroseovarius sp.]